MVVRSVVAMMRSARRRRQSCLPLCDTTSHDFEQVSLLQRQSVAAQDVRTECLRFSKIRPTELLRERSRGQTKLLTEPCLKASKQSLKLRPGGAWQFQADLEPPPHRPVQKLWVIAGTNDDHIAWQLVDLEQQRANDPLHFACLVRIPALFPERLELIEEEHARTSSDMVEDLTQSPCRFTQQAAHQGIVAKRQKRNSQPFGERFRQRRLAISRRTTEQEPMPRLQAV